MELLLRQGQPSWPSREQSVSSVFITTVGLCAYFSSWWNGYFSYREDEKYWFQSGLKIPFEHPKKRKGLGPQVKSRWKKKVRFLATPPQWLSSFTLYTMHFECVPLFLPADVQSLPFHVFFLFCRAHIV
jgi:hypothetical protein